nr:cyclooxygenase b [Prochaetoderma californicum]
MQRLRRLLKPNPETLHHLLVNYKWLWSIINSVTFLSDSLMTFVYLLRSNAVDSPPLYTSAHEYITLEASYNLSYYARGLPAVPTDCPTPMGIKGKRVLPDPKIVVERLFKRTVFKPEPMHSSLLLAYFAQHFIHQFFKTDHQKGPGFQWGGHGVDVSHVYGKNKHVENLLRSFQDGKLKTQVLNNEEYPPYQADVPGVPMTWMGQVADNNKFALGHQFFGMMPGLFLYATIWMREHNRVCDELRRVHPEWDDERLFQTGKLIIQGETIKIVIEDYVQHLSNYHFLVTFKPELLHTEVFQYQNRIAAEFDHMYRWHPLMPDEFNISGVVYPIMEFIFKSDLVVKYGTKVFTDSLSRQIAGQMTARNHGFLTQSVALDTIENGRKLRFQPYNNYRKNLDFPHTKFSELTDDPEVAATLEELYGDIDGVEFYAGLLSEKRRENNMFGALVIEMGGPFSVKGLMSTPICSPRYWKPSTFGGDVGFNIVKTASLEKLFCKNIPGDECPLISFVVPPENIPSSEKCENCKNDEL